MQQLTMDLENISLKLIITYIHIVLQKIYLVSEETGKSGKEVMYSSKCFNSNYMEFVVRGTCDKLIFTSDEGFINTHTISKQVIPKINMNMKSPSATLDIGVPHIRTLVINFQRIWFHTDCKYINQKTRGCIEVYK